MRRLILNFHLAVALIAGAFIALLGVTGSILTFEPELDRLLHPAVSYVKPGRRILSLGEIGAAVSRQYPDEPIVAYLPSLSPEFPTRIILSRGIISVDQYTGNILGVRTRGLTFLGLVRALHVRLASGDRERLIVRCAACAMLLSLFSGLYLWWPARRMRIRRPWFSSAFWFDLHNAVGVFSFAFLLVLAGTGIVIGFEDQASSLLGKFAGSSAMPVKPALRALPSEHSGLELTPDQAVDIARAQLPGTVADRVQMPRFGGSYQVSLVNTRDRTLGTRNSVSLDPWSGQILSTTRASDISLGERILAWNQGLHTGAAFGISSRIIVAAAGMLVPVQIVSGFWIWLRRRTIMHSSRSE